MARTNPAMNPDTSIPKAQKEKPTPVTMGFCDETLRFRLSKHLWLNYVFNSFSLRWQKRIISVVFFWQNFFPNLKFYFIPLLSAVYCALIILLIIYYRAEIITTGRNVLELSLVLLTSLITVWQFISRKKMETLQELNTRFIESHSYNDIINYLISQENGTSQSDPINENSIELFYRFFEELELAIRKGVVSSKNAFDLFAYYAMIGLYLPNGLLKEYRYSESWALLKSFERRMSTKYKFYYTLSYKQSHKQNTTLK